MSLRPWLLLGVALMAAGSGYLAYRALEPGERKAVADSGATDLGATDTGATDLRGQSLLGQRRPDYTLGSVDGSRVSASDFDGKVVLVNFWATWCAPCREEMPMLMALRESRRAEGLEVVGIAMDDVQQARDFVDELGIEYPNLVGSTDVMATMRLYGNASGTLPYSVLIDRAGFVRWSLLGVLEQPSLEREIGALLGNN
jgi:peroxiredoxin